MPSEKSPLEVGRNGETVAVAYLVKRGCNVTATNYRTRFGEVDIVFMEGNALVFCEVKTSSNGSSGFLIYRVPPTKQHRLASAAEDYLQKYPGHQGDVRFDVLLLSPSGRDLWKVEHIREAFSIDN